MDLKKVIRTVPDFPKKGILFFDITTLIHDAKAFKQVIDELAERYSKIDFDYIASAEARGYIFGGALAFALGKGFIPIRKPGKLPWKTTKATYEKEYGPDTLEMHADAVKKGDKVLIVDDLLATGGTPKAMIELVENCGGKVVGLAFLIELIGLHGRKKLKGHEVYSMVQFKVKE
jgi:adenine phosphoribosyltransferase